jgi:hypothetical protein
LLWLRSKARVKLWKDWVIYIEGYYGKKVQVFGCRHARVVHQNTFYICTLWIQIAFCFHICAQAIFKMVFKNNPPAFHRFCGICSLAGIFELCRFFYTPCIRENLLLIEVELAKMFGKVFPSMFFNFYTQLLIFSGKNTLRKS